MKLLDRSRCLERLRWKEWQAFAAFFAVSGCVYDVYVHVGPIDSPRGPLTYFGGALVHSKQITKGA